jgi:hypothetical protein
VYAGAYETSFNIVVMVSDAVLQSISIGGSYKKDYELGEEFSKAGITVTGHFSDNSTQNLTGYAFMSGYSSLKRGVQNVTVQVNRFTLPLEGITTRIGPEATVFPNIPYEILHTNHQLVDCQTVYIKGETPTLEVLNLRVKIYSAKNKKTILLTLEDGGLTPADFPDFSDPSVWNPEQIGKQTLSFNLDGRPFTIDCYVIDTESAVWFEYGYMRHGGDIEGHGPGEGKFYAQPGETLVIAPVRYLLGYNEDHTDAGVTYQWTVGGGAAYTISGGGEFLHITPGAPGTYPVSVSVTGRDYPTGTTVTRSASTELVCYTESLPEGTFTSPLKNFAPGQYAKDGSGYGWSLGSAGGYEIWEVKHQNSYYIRGNAFTGWCEPGVVWVQEDRNGNGLPDEMWYELKGGEDDDPVMKNLITRRYALRFFAGTGMVEQAGTTVWTDAKGRRFRSRSAFSDNWGVEGGWVTYTGTLLRDDGNIATGSYGYTMVTGNLTGYVDAIGDRVYINNAVNAAGTPVTLTDVRFIKVQTAVFHYGGIFNEVSTEIYAADYLGDQTDFPLPEDS